MNDGKSSDDDDELLLIGSNAGDISANRLVAVRCIV